MIFIETPPYRLYNLGNFYGGIASIIPEKFMPKHAKTKSGFKDALTGKPILLDDPKHNSKCPQCGSFSVISDQPSIRRCLRCNWNDD